MVMKGEQFPADLVLLASSLRWVSSSLCSRRYFFFAFYKLYFQQWKVLCDDCQLGRRDQLETPVCFKVGIYSFLLPNNVCFFCLVERSNNFIFRETRDCTTPELLANLNAQVCPCNLLDLHSKKYEKDQNPYVCKKKYFHKIGSWSANNQIRT